MLLYGVFLTRRRLPDAFLIAVVDLLLKIAGAQKTKKKTTCHAFLRPARG